MVAAHKSTVTSLEIVIHNSRKYILSGGSDKNVFVHSEDGLCVGNFGKPGGWRLGPQAVRGKKPAPPRLEGKFSSQLPEEAKEAAADKERRRAKHHYHAYDFDEKTKGLLKYVAPFKQVDLTQFPVERPPASYEDLYFQLFGKKLDKKMK